MGDADLQLTIDLPLQRDHEHPPFMRVSTPHSEQAAIACVADLQKHGWKKLVRKRPKSSQTAVTVVERESSNDGALPYTRLRLEPITGRTHQLRVHWYVARAVADVACHSYLLTLAFLSAALGFPIVGDPTYSLYGEGAPNGGLQSLQSYRVDSDADGSIIAAIASRSAVPVSRCPIEIQKAWTTEHAPNDKPMCLHAAVLQLKHPETGKPFRWEVRPQF